MKRTPLLRKTLMRQALRGTEFAHLRERPPLVLPDNPPPPRVISMRLVFNPQPKREYVRSDAMMKAYRLLPCQHCGKGGEDAGVCGAHSNWAVHGKGKSIKADDNRAASLCWECHWMLDQGSALNEAEKMTLWWRAHVRTVRRLQALGLWPDGVPVPDVLTNPFAVELEPA